MKALVELLIATNRAIERSCDHAILLITGDRVVGLIESCHMIVMYIHHIGICEGTETGAQDVSNLRIAAAICQRTCHVDRCDVMNQRLSANIEERALETGSRVDVDSARVHYCAGLQTHIIFRYVVAPCRR